MVENECPQPVAGACGSRIEVSTVGEIALALRHPFPLVLQPTPPRRPPSDPAGFRGSGDHNRCTYAPAVLHFHRSDGPMSFDANGLGGCLPRPWRPHGRSRGLRLPAWQGMATVDSEPWPRTRLPLRPAGLSIAAPALFPMQSANPLFLNTDRGDTPLSPRLAFV